MNYEALRVGLPSKKRKYDLLTADDVAGDCYLEGAYLYVLYYNYINDENSSTYVKLIDLNNFNGSEEQVENLSFHSNISANSIRLGEDCLILAGRRNFIIKKSTGATLLDEYGDTISDFWQKSGSCFIHEGLYYRPLNILKPEEGIDVYDLGSRSIVKHLDVDVQNPRILNKYLFAGVNNRNNLCIYSMKDGGLVFELQTEEYFSGFDSGRLRFEHYGDVLAVACGGAVVALDLNKLEVVKHVECLSEEIIQKAIIEYNTNESTFSISGISIFGDLIFVFGGRRVSFLMCIDISDFSFPVRWVNVGMKKILAKYSGGDVLFAIKDSRPVAFDAYNGELIWEASAATIANKIQIGDTWVVFSQLSGEFQCFKWTKEYISPCRN